MKKVVVVICSLMAALIAVTCYQYVHFYDGRLHVIFCDVGQGSATLLVTPNRKYILDDAGPNQKVLDCLARHMPYWERRLDLMILTHPHADHYFGMFELLPRYTIKSFASEDMTSTAVAFQELRSGLMQRQIPVQRVLAGDSWQVGEVTVTVVGPSEEYLKHYTPESQDGENAVSVIIQVTYGSFSVLLPGDTQVSGLASARPFISDSLTILATPHHGSRTGLDEHILTSLAPKAAVISSGADNKYGHPHPDILRLLESQRIPYHRTDRQGDIEFVSDGKNWWVY